MLTSTSSIASTAPKQFVGLTDGTAPSEPSSPTTSTYSLKSSESSFGGIRDEEEDAAPFSIHAHTAYSMDDHLSTLRSVSQGNCNNEQALLALPKRRNKSQRPLALQLAKQLYPDISEIAAIIKYEDLTITAKAVARQKRKERLAAEMQPKNNSGGKLLKIQGPWAGQDIDPVDLKGPAAIPMPVKIGKTEDFEPIFGFLSQNKEFTKSQNSNPNFDFPVQDKTFTGTHGFELLWQAPLVEFKRGIIYEDGRLDLCKQVVGPTHIGNLMEALESNRQIRHFLLGNNAISTTGAKAVAEFIQKHPNRIETWYLAGCHITRHGLSLLVPQMITSSTITNLWFKRNPFGPNSGALLAELVLRIPHLRTLDLETTELGDEGTRRFIEAITGRPTALRHLYLNANGIGQKACASLAEYLADPHCGLESLFLSTNPIGDAGMFLLAPGLAKNKTLKRLACASTGLTSKGVSCLAGALSETHHPLHTLDLGASQTTTVHGQKFNYLDDSCIESLKPLVMSPALRWLNLGRTVFSVAGIQEIRSSVEKSELVALDMHRVQIAGEKTTSHGKTQEYDGTHVSKSCSLQVRNRLVENQAKYYPHIKYYEDFLNSEELRFLRNTSDIRKIDSMYRTRDKRLGLPMNLLWEEGDPTWKLIVDDARTAEES